MYTCVIIILLLVVNFLKGVSMILFKLCGLILINLYFYFSVRYFYYGIRKNELSEGYYSCHAACTTILLSVYYKSILIFLLGIFWFVRAYPRYLVHYYNAMKKTS